ncbi:hypothetical protein ACH3XW_42070 [Acanthocheilonema viteae]
MRLTTNHLDSDTNSSPNFSTSILMSHFDVLLENKVQNDSDGKPKLEKKMRKEQISTMYNGTVEMMKKEKMARIWC